MNLDKLRIFYHAAMAKNFTKSGLNLSPSAISRHIADLEYALKAKLFIRHPKGMALTPEGAKLLETCHTVFQELEDVRSLISVDTDKPEGLIKVATPAGWISNIVIFLLRDFVNEHPDIRLSLTSLDKVPDFNRSEADIALLPFKPDDRDLISQKVATLHLGLYASREYLKKHGSPKTVADLKDHHLIRYGGEHKTLPGINWHMTQGLPHGQEHVPHLSTNNLYYAAEAGYGITTLAKENIFLRSERLVEILPDVQGPVLDSYCVFPKRLEKSKRIRAFLHYISQAAQENKWLDAIDEA